MSIRNKRLMKEQHELDKFELHWPIDWTHHDNVIIKTLQKDIYLNIEVGLKYPFAPPHLYVMKEKKIDYVEWFVKLKSKYKEFDKLIHIPCVCCINIMCNWVPTYRIQSILNDFLKYHSYFKQLESFSIIYGKINRFDDLIYKNIILYLIYNA